MQNQQGVGEFSWTILDFTCWKHKTEKAKLWKEKIDNEKHCLWKSACKIIPCRYKKKENYVG